jgi:hypothetical protein
MIVATSLVEGAALLAGLLAGDPTIRVHPAPMPTRPVSGPCVIVGTPSIVATRTVTPGGGYTMEARLLVVGADTLGTGLLDLTDRTVALLVAQGLRVATSPVQWQPPGTPAPIPAVEITVE